MIPTLEAFDEYLAYGQNTGLFTWKKSTYRRGKSGDIAGSLADHGYLTIGFRGKLYYAHRLAWYFVTGIYPNQKIDHLDGCRNNNSFTNLRLASDQQNAHNAAGHHDSQLQLKGVRRARSKFAARIHVAGKTTHLGTFATSEQASRAYKQAAQQYFGDFAPNR